MLSEWAEKWGVSAEAMRDLISTLAPVERAARNGSEAKVLVGVQMSAAAAGWKLWRNNVGACRADDGRLIRYGLCNDSKRINDRFKSSDLIGIRPVVITTEHVGTTIGQFAAVETKREDWRPGKDKREGAQATFMALVQDLGGCAGFSTGELPD